MTSLRKTPPFAALPTPLWASGARHAIFDVKGFGRRKLPKITPGYYSRVEAGSGYSITRIGPFDSDFHAYDGLIELDRTTFYHDAPTKNSKPQPNRIDLTCGYYECQARCYCGSADGARKLFAALERILHEKPKVAEAILQAGDYESIPFQAMLATYPSGLGLVHFAGELKTSAWLALFLDELKRFPDCGLDELPVVYDTPDFFDTYHSYCDDDFIEQTSFELARACWDASPDQAGLAEYLEDTALLFPWLDAQKQRDAIDHAARKPEPQGHSASRL